MKPLINPRLGDAEDDASSPKSRSLWSITGTLLAEVSRLREETDRLRSDADRRVRETHNLYRRDLVLRSTSLPQVRSKRA